MQKTVEDICSEANASSLRPLPQRAQRVLSDLHAPQRLVAHLILVHDAASQLLDELGALLDVGVDTISVRFGAAVHDIGKALHPNELSGPGSEHEAAGEAHLLAQGIPPDLSKFARTHGLDPEDATLELDDLLVIAADKLWKGKRVARLEERLIAELASNSASDPWSIWEPVNSVFDRLSERADARLSWQSRYPITRTG